MPLFPSLHGYERAWMRADLVAGLAVWAVLVPEALAYASIAGVSPVVGLYAAPPALVLYAAFGSSRHLVAAPMAATAALSAAAVAELATGPDDALAFTAALALVTGLLALVAGLLRFGFVAGFISDPVLKGFVIGLALTIIVGQVPKVLGVAKGSGPFFEQLRDVLGHLDEVHGWSLVVGVTSIVTVLLLHRYLPGVPAALVAVVGGVLAVAAFHLDDHGVAIIGHIDPGLPSIGLPEGLRVRDYLATTASAVGIALVGFVEGLGAAETYATREGYEIDPDRELLGLGAANLGAGLTQGMVVNGSLSKTAENGSAGARTQLSTLVVAAMTVLTLLLFTGFFHDVPTPTLGALVIAAVVELVDIPALRDLYRLYSHRLGEAYGRTARADFIAAMAAVVGVLVFGTLPGLFLGIGMSLLLLVERSSRPHVAELGKVVGTTDQFGDLERHPENPRVPGVAIVRVEGGLFFANAEVVRHALQEEAGRDGVHLVLLDAGTIPFIDVTAIEMLAELGDSLAARGVGLAVAHDVGPVRDLLRLAAGERGTIAVYRTVQDAIEASTLGPGADDGA